MTKARRLGGGGDLDITTTQAATSSDILPADTDNRALYVPDLPDDCDVLTAGFKYADAGWFVGPMRSDGKHPGSLLGKGWPEKTSQDPHQLSAWFAGAAEDVGLFLHAGRSGALILDVDAYLELSFVVNDAIKMYSPPFQSTRGNDPRRGHYVFAQPQDRLIGNGQGALGKGWGEVRGNNGIVVVQPSRHEKAEAGGRYKWIKTGPVPFAQSIADALPSATSSEQPATVAAVAAFLAEHATGSNDRLLNPILAKFDRDVAAGGSRHDALRDCAAWACRDIATGLLSGNLAMTSLWERFDAATRANPDPRRLVRSEFQAVFAWAVAQALVSDPVQRAAEVEHRLVDVKVDAFGQPAPMINGTTHPGAAEVEHRLVDPVAFWTERPVLAHIHAFAQARRCSPWAVLGVILVRVIVATPPQAVLPPLVGSVAGLNLFVALVGPSGGGKGASEAAALDAVDVGVPIEVASIGSGEGIGHLYAHRDKAAVVRDREAVLFTVPEVDNLTALVSRQGATLMPQLRQAWSGERLGFAYADRAKALPLERHTYRLGLVLGVQPGRAGPLLEDADGGTPQRFLWLPTTDPDAPDDPPDAPERWSLRAQPWRPASAGLTTIAVPPVAKAAVDRARLDRLRGTGEALDGHALLARLKTAAALSLLDGRRTVHEDDWRLAGVVVAVSDATRTGVVRHLASQAERSNEARGRAEGVRAAVAGDTADDLATKRVAVGVLRRLHESGECSRSDAKRATTSRDRQHFEGAVERLVAAGQVVQIGTDHGARLRPAEVSR